MQVITEPESYLYHLYHQDTNSSAPYYTEWKNSLLERSTMTQHRNLITSFQFLSPWKRFCFYIYVPAKQTLILRKYKINLPEIYKRLHQHRYRGVNLQQLHEILVKRNKGTCTKSSFNHKAQWRYSYTDPGRCPIYQCNIKVMSFIPSLGTEFVLSSVRFDIARQ